MRARRDFGTGTTTTSSSSSHSAPKFGAPRDGPGRGAPAFGGGAGPLGATRSTLQAQGASKWGAPGTAPPSRSTAPLSRGAGRPYGSYGREDGSSTSGGGSSSSRARLLLGLLVFLVACTPLYLGSTGLGKRGWTKSLSRRALGLRVSSWRRGAAAFGILETPAAESGVANARAAPGAVPAASASPVLPSETKTESDGDVGSGSGSATGLAGSATWTQSGTGLSSSTQEVSHPVDQDSPKKPRPVPTEKLVLELKGSVFSRLEQLCAALWYLSQQPQGPPGVPLAVAWRADPDVLGTSLQDLFEPSSIPSYSGPTSGAADGAAAETEGGVSLLGGAGAGGGEGGGGSGGSAVSGLQWALVQQVPDFSDVDSGYTKHEAKVRSCDCQLSPDAQDAPVGVTFWTLPGGPQLEPHKDPSAVGAGSGTASLRKCMAGLRPSQAVAELLGKVQEESRAGLRDALVLHLEAEGPEGPRLCEACPGDASSRVLCAARHISRLFLCNQTTQVVVVPESAENGVSLQEVFHASRAPLLLSPASERATTRCPSPAAFLGQGPDATAGLVPEKLRRCMQLYVAEMALARQLSPNGLLHFQSNPASRFLCSLSAPAAASSTTAAGDAASALAQPGGDGVGGGGGSDAAGGTGTGHGQGGEVPVSPMTYTCPSSDARLLTPICQGAPLPPLSSYKYSSNTIVDEELGVVYCGVDRAASSTLKTVLRTLKGLSPFPTQPWKVHDRHVNGLRYLDSPEYTGVNEAQGIRQMTRRDYVKFVFVRNPFYRALSLYLDVYKFTSGSQKKDNYAMALARGSSNWQLFREEYAALFDIKSIPGRVKGHVQLTYAWTKQLSFDQFLTLAVSVLRKAKRPEPRIALQTELCRLDSIKYDLVGRVESFEDDAKALKALLLRKWEAHNRRDLALRLNSSSFDAAIQRGNRLQRTVDMVVAMYSRETAKIVYENYKPDFLVDLNGIYFQTPEPITAMME